MGKKYEEIQDEPLKASEPAVSCGIQTDVHTFGGMHISSVHNSEQLQTDEYGRIMLTESMCEAVSKAEQSLTDGACLNEEMFQARFARWL